MKNYALVGCSDFRPEMKDYVPGVISALEMHGMQVFCESAVLSAEAAVTPEEKAMELNGYFADPKVSAIFDMSGGDSAHKLLPYLDFEQIGSSQAVFCGYSDLTVMHNAIFAKTGKAGILWSVMTLLRSASDNQHRRFATDDFYRIRVRFLQGFAMEGVLVGGNTRCFLKLAGTPYFPDLRNRILLLEARSGDAKQIRTYFSRLHQLGAFDQIRGVILGTFTQLEQNGEDPWGLLREFVSIHLPVARTYDIGHGPDSRAARIGGYYRMDASQAAAVPVVQEEKS